MAVTTPVVYVLRALGLGDLLTAVPALRGLRRHYPVARLVLAAPERYRELALMTGAVDDVVPTAALGDLAPLRHPPELAVNLHGSGPQSISHVVALEPRAVLSHRHRRFPAVPGPPWREDLHEVDRWCMLLASAGIASDPSDLILDRPAATPGRAGTVVVHPGASAAARRWPLDRFAQIAAALHADGHDVLVTGVADERPLAIEVAEAAGLPESSVMAGRLTVRELVSLIGCSRLVVCGDTGVGHVATATSTPSVVLFGPTAPSRWGPRNPDRHLVLWSGRLGDPHGDRPHRGLLEIAVSDVLDASRALLARSA
ncbi:glycosyltransferase family 9 protein [Mycobacterium yunnanensis]|uniref:Glycosyltransferase family 9 protein n=1 Tax=Mycobacterium yunnanensis TaxID=368477 RepID=A0A9X2YL10_9MYCO|nr:glycosyltransferase family 9 protein [Mycobacterium yunnanensis]MCV7421272.1 glycosyltransferase family 9 protein [Mycobacterium yunnanensis]